MRVEKRMQVGDIQGGWGITEQEVLFVYATDPNFTLFNYREFPGHLYQPLSEWEDSTLKRYIKWVADDRQT